MKKKIVAVLTAVVAVVLALLVFPTNKKVVNAVGVEPEQVESSWLVEDDGLTPYLSNVEAGITSGYGDYVLGDENVKLTTNANLGFKVVGWKINLTDNSTYFVKDNLEINDVNFSVSYEDTNLDNNANKSILNISQIGEDYKIEPVFDFIYYKVNITNFFSKLTGYTNVIINNTELFYKTLEDNVYYNAIVKEGNQYFYYGNILLTENNMLCTIHTKADSTLLEQHININKGAFRYSESEIINSTFNLNVTNNYDTSVNLDLQQVVVEDSDTDVLQSITQTQDLRTDTFTINFSLTQINNLLNLHSTTINLNLNYHNLFLVTVNPKVDGYSLQLDNPSLGEYNKLEPVDGVLYDSFVNNLILKDIVGDFYYYKFETTDGTLKFLVKNQLNNNSNPFILSYKKIIQYVEGYSTYNYYSFDYISSNNFGDIADNQNIEINYLSVEYDVEIKSALLLDGESSAREINIPCQNGFSLPRGKSNTILSSNNPQNKGYSFYCFATNLMGNNWEELEATNKDSVLVEMDATRPTKLTIYAVYKYINYKVNVTNINSKFIEYNSDTYFAVNRISVLSGAYNQNLSFGVCKQSADATISLNATFEINKNFNITESFTLNAVANNGFKVLGFNYDGTNFELNTEFEIATFAKEENIINIAILEDYENYALTYKINAGAVAEDRNGIMADIFLTILGKDYKIEEGDTNLNDELVVGDRTINVKTLVDENNVNQIILSNLHLFDAILFEAKGRLVSAEDSLIYQFAQFSYGSSVRLQGTFNDVTNKWQANLDLRENCEITVVFTTPKIALALSVNLDNILDIQKDVSVYNLAGEKVTIGEGNVVILSVSESAEYTISFANMQNKGYSFVNFETELTGTKQENQTTISFNFSLTGVTNVTYNMELQFTEIIYHLQVNQQGGGRDGQLVTFSETNTTFKEISITNHMVEFEMPEGYWIENIKVRALNGSYVELLGLNSNQTNNTVGTKFEYDIPIFESLLNYVTKNENTYTIEFKVEYKIHTYNIRINYLLGNPKNNEDDRQITYPEIALNYTFGGNTYTINGVYNNNVLQFSNIEWGSEINLEVTGKVLSGTELAGWSIVSSENEFNFNNNNLTGVLTYNAELNYYINYIEYEIVFVKQHKDETLSNDEVQRAGTPYAVVADNESTVLKILDNATLFANANKTFGYTHSKMYYDVYKPYTYNASTWNEEWENLYYLENDIYLKNQSNKYNETLTYFKLVREETNFSRWDNIKFNTNFKLLEGENNKIAIYVVYDYLELSLQKHEELVGEFITRKTVLYFDGNQSYYENKVDTIYMLDEVGIYYIKNGSKQYLVVNSNVNVEEITQPIDYPDGSFYIDEQGNLVYLVQDKILTKHTLSNVGQGVGKINIELEEFADVKIYIGNSKEEYDGSTLLNYKDNVSINISFKDVVVDGLTTNLSNGIIVESITVLGNRFLVEAVEGNSNLFNLTFNVKSVLEYLKDEDNNTIKYTINYKVQEKTLTFKTNVYNAEDASFYQNGNAYNLFVDENAYGFGSQSVPMLNGAWRGGDIQINSSLQYLARVKLRSYNRDYANYLQPTMVRAWLKTIKTNEDGSKVEELVCVANTEEELKQYGVYASFNNGVLSSLEYRYFNNLTIELVLQPTLKFNGEVKDGIYNYFKYYQFSLTNTGGEEELIGQNQFLTFGVAGGYDILTADYFNNRIKADYYLVKEDNSLIATNPKDVGKYKVVLSFSKMQEGDSNYPTWLEKINLEFEIYLNILPAELELNYVGQTNFEKVYDGTASFDAGELIANLHVMCNNVDITNFFAFNHTGGTRYYALITNTNEQGLEQSVTAAAEIRYNLTLFNLYINSALHGKNFILNNSSYTIKSAVQIKRRPLTISGLKVHNKVYDGTNKAPISNSELKLIGGVVAGDDIAINNNNIVANFASAEVGENINVYLNLNNIIYGNSVNNYEVTGLTYATTANIYPYSVTAHVDGIGEIKIINQRGAEDYNLANLIPIGVKLSVTKIEKDTPTYSRIYGYLAQFLSNKNVYGLGYQLKFTKNADGNMFSQPIDNRLFLELPTISKLNSALYLTQDNFANKLDYTVNDGKVLIDLSQAPNVDRIILTQTRTMFAWWQIMLIILFIVLIIAIIVTIILVKRYNKLKQYRRHDKI